MDLLTTTQSANKILLLANSLHQMYTDQSSKKHQQHNNYNTKLWLSNLMNRETQQSKKISPHFRRGPMAFVSVEEEKTREHERLQPNQGFRIYWVCCRVGETILARIGTTVRLIRRWPCPTCACDRVYMNLTIKDENQIHELLCGEENNAIHVCTVLL